jgi:hypothetical protein
MFHLDPNIKGVLLGTLITAIGLGFKGGISTYFELVKKQDTTSNHLVLIESKIEGRFNSIDKTLRSLGEVSDLKLENLKGLIRRFDKRLNSLEVSNKNSFLESHKIMKSLGNSGGSGDFNIIE